MRKRIMALALVLVMALTVFCGCSDKKAAGEDLDFDAVVLTVGEDEIALREAYFMLKWRQSSYQAMATAQFGDDWYEQDLTGEGPFGEYIKDTIITELEEMYVLAQNAEKYNVSLTDDENAAIEEVVSTVMKANDEEAQAAMGLSEDVIKRVVTNYTIYAKVYNEILKDVDTNVSMEEAAQKTYSYIYQQLVTYDEDGNETAMSTDEQNSYYALLQMVKDDVDGGKSFDDAAEDYGLSTASHSFGKQDDGSFNDINSVVDKLKVGEVSDVIPVEGGIFLLHLDTDYDEEATESARSDIAYDKLEEAFNTAYDELKADVSIELNEELWETATFENAVIAYVESDN